MATTAAVWLPTLGLDGLMAGHRHVENGHVVHHRHLHDGSHEHDAEPMAAPAIVAADQEEHGSRAWPSSGPAAEPTHTHSHHHAHAGATHHHHSHDIPAPSIGDPGGDTGGDVELGSTATAQPPPRQGALPRVSAPAPARASAPESPAHQHGEAPDEPERGFPDATVSSTLLALAVAATAPILKPAVPPAPFSAAPEQRIADRALHPRPLPLFPRPPPG